MIDEGLMRLSATTGDCEVGAIGAYRWSTEATALEMAMPSDQCADRRDVLHGDWYPLGDTPIIEVDPGGDPVTIDSPIGPIEWRVVAGQPYLWAGWDGQVWPAQRPRRQVVAVDGGFAAAIDDQAQVAPHVSRLADRALVFSPDGIAWRSIPSPPSTIGFIAAHGEHLYVAPWTAPWGPGPESVHVTADLGATWTALELEDPPFWVSSIHAGGAGVILTAGPGSSLWLLDGEAFAEVTTPAPFVDVLVLDTGFFAVAEHAQQPYWRSDDGRTWTEVTGVPGTEMWAPDLTSRGDAVYLSDRSEGTGYTSADGGRTWRAPGMRPGEDLAVSDAGYVTVQPALFGPVVGVVWVSSDDTDWQRVVNPWPPLWTFAPVVSGDTILVPGDIDAPWGESTFVDTVGHLVPTSG